MIDELFFPENATQEERQTDWKKIARISDMDFGFDTPKEKSGKIKFSVRVVLINDKDEICVVKSEKYGYMQLPGGGIDKGESIIEALHREAKEETGFLINDINPIGYVLEKREDIRNNHDWDQSVSYVFKALPDKKVGTNYTEDERAEDFRPIWMKLDDFIIEQEKNEGKTESYSGCFSNRRDLEIAKFIKSGGGELGRY
ncbi:NUDIX domain-containing protein [Candidatus Saccharibacteria bacterium]|nr:NUDIX domain-containing protein [Candidatus Saccharibacteria bacterium]